MLLANQQEDGDGLKQNIVRNLGKGSRKGLTEGFREVIKIDNERALEVPEGCSEVTVRESPDELTRRAEEVGSLKTYINVNSRVALGPRRKRHQQGFGKPQAQPACGMEHSNISSRVDDSLIDPTSDCN